MDELMTREMKESRCSNWDAYFRKYESNSDLEDLGFSEIDDIITNFSKKKRKPAIFNKCNVSRREDYSDSDSVRTVNYILECNKKSRKYPHTYKSRRSSKLGSNKKKISLNYKDEISSENNVQGLLSTKEKKILFHHEENNTNAIDKISLAQTNYVYNNKKLFLKDCSVKLIKQPFFYDKYQKSNSNKESGSIKSIFLKDCPVKLIKQPFFYDKYQKSNSNKESGSIKRCNVIFKDCQKLSDSISEVKFTHISSPNERKVDKMVTKYKPQETEKIQNLEIKSDDKSDNFKSSFKKKNLSKIINKIEKTEQLINLEKCASENLAHNEAKNRPEKQKNDNSLCRRKKYLQTNKTFEEYKAEEYIENIKFDNIGKNNTNLKQQNVQININKHADTNFKIQSSDEVSEKENLIFKNISDPKRNKNSFISENITTRDEAKSKKCVEIQFYCEDKNNSKDKILNTSRKVNKSLSTRREDINLEENSTEEKVKNFTKSKISIINSHSSDSSDSDNFVFKNKLYRKRKENANFKTKNEVSHLDPNKRAEEQIKRHIEKINIDESSNAEIKVYKTTSDKKFNIGPLKSNNLQETTNKIIRDYKSTTETTQTNKQYLEPNSKVNSGKFKNKRYPIFFSSKHISESDSSDDDGFIFKSYSRKNTIKNSSIQENFQNNSNSKENCDSKNLHNTAESRLLDRNASEPKKCVKTIKFSENLNKKYCDNQLINKSDDKLVLNGNKSLVSEDSKKIFSKKTGVRRILGTINTLNKTSSISDEQNTSKNGKTKDISKVYESFDTKKNNFKTCDSYFNAYLVNSNKYNKIDVENRKIDHESDDSEVFTSINDKCKISISSNSRNETKNIKDCNGRNCDDFNESEICISRNKSKSSEKQKNNSPSKTSRIKSVFTIENENSINQNNDYDIVFKKPRTSTNIERYLESITENKYQPKVLRKAKNVVVKSDENFINDNLKTCTSVKKCIEIQLTSDPGKKQNTINMENDLEPNFTSPKRNVKLSQSIFCSTPVTNRKRKNIFDISVIADEDENSETVIKRGANIKRRKYRNL